MDSTAPARPEAVLPDTPLADPVTSPRRLALASWIHGGPAPKWHPSEPGSDEPPTFGPIHVLEIGCGHGENLLPLAFYDPEGRYVGLETHPGRLDAARDAAAELGLSNVRFELFGHLPEDALEPFDFILVRGTFARVPDALAGEILALAAQTLAPDGLLYIDYPVLPGAASAALVRELLAPLAGVVGGPTAQVERARTGATRLREIIARPEHPYPHLLSAELARTAALPAAELHRHLFSDPARAFFHREIAERAAHHGLRFVCDAAWNQTGAHVPPALRAELTRLGLGGVDLEQALDVFCYRSSRASVFCRVDCPPSVERGPAALDHLFITSPLAPEGDTLRMNPGVETPFTDPTGKRIVSVDPLLKAAIVVLRDTFPKPLGFAQLVGLAVAVLHEQGAAGDPNDEQLAGVARDLWALHGQGLVDLLPTPPSVPTTTARMLHALARHESATRATLTTPMHTLLPLKGFDAAVARHLAPGMDEEALIALLTASILSGEVPLELGGVRLTDPTLLSPIARGLLGRSLAMLRRFGLLEGEPETPTA